MPVLTANRILGCVEPRLFTPPLQELVPGTSLGFDVIEWYENVIGGNLYPHQKWLLIHALEYQPGTTTLRFRKVLVLMARRNAKTHTLAVYSAYLMAQRENIDILNSSVSLDTARESFESLEEIILDNPAHFPDRAITHANGKEAIRVQRFRNKYKVVPSTRRGGRGLAADLAIEDELREHQNWDAHNALEPTTITRPSSQLWMLSNAGDEQSVVLKSIRARALTYDDPHLFIAEWSAPEDAEITDRSAWAQANPLMNRMWDEEALESALEKPASDFRTENLCASVPALDEAIAADSWKLCFDEATLDAYKNNIAVVLEISPDNRHGTLVAASPLDDGRIRIETVKAWEDIDSVGSAIRADLPDILKAIRPRAFGYFPQGPAAAISTDLKDIRNKREIKTGDVNAACMGFAESVVARIVTHNGDELLADHIIRAKKLRSGEGWKFSRKDGGQCDAAYAAAGATWLARSLPKRSKLKLITPREE